MTTKQEIDYLTNLLCNIMKKENTDLAETLSVVLAPTGDEPFDKHICKDKLVKHIRRRKT